MKPDFVFDKVEVSSQSVSRDAQVLQHLCVTVTYVCECVRMKSILDLFALGVRTKSNVDMFALCDKYR